MKNSLNLNSNKKNWLWWTLHLIIISLIFWFVIGPIITLTFHNGGKELNPLGLAILLGSILFPLIVIQLATLIFCRAESTRKKWMIVLLSYPISVGPLVACSLRLTHRWKLQATKRWLYFILILLGTTLLYWVLTNLYAATIFSQIVNKVLQT